MHKTYLYPPIICIFYLNVSFYLNIDAEMCYFSVTKTLKVLLLHPIVRKDCFYLSGCLTLRGPYSYSCMKEFIIFK